MPRISQRALIADALEYMEKDAAKGPKIKVQLQSDELIDALKRLFGGSNKFLSSGNGSKPKMPFDLFNEAVNAGNWGDVNDMSTSMLKALRKKLEQKELSKARKLVGENKDILSETGKVLLNGGGTGKNQGLGAAAGAGAGIGGLAGAFQDTDEESTNMLGVTQKRKGGLGARLKNMAMGAAAGGAIGAGLKAKGVAKKSIGDSVKQVSKGGLDALKGMRDEDIVAKALSEFSPVEIEGDISKALTKAYENIAKRSGKFKDTQFNTLMDNALFSGLNNINGIDPKYNGVLERFYDKLRGGDAKRKELADSTMAALNSIIPGFDPEGGALRAGISRLNADFGGNSIEALKALRKDPSKYIDANDMGTFKGILNNLFDTKTTSPFGKAFQKRYVGFATPWSQEVSRPGAFGSDTLLDWIFGKKSPERLQKYYDEFVANTEI